jgi:putative hydrolase of the HAD superfamily
VSSHPIFEFHPERVRAAVFDLGGVLFEGGPREVMAFGTRVGVKAEEWAELRREVFGNNGTWARLERGECTFAHFLEELRHHVHSAGGRATVEEAAAFMGASDPLSRRSVVREPLIEMVLELREVMQTALLTNNVREWREGWKSVLDTDALFDVVIDSSEVGARKPEPAIYETTRAALGVKHEEIFFVDDIGQNLKAAHALGWQTYLFREEADALRVLQRLYRAHERTSRHVRP